MGKVAEHGVYILVCAHMHGGQDALHRPCRSHMASGRRRRAAVIVWHTARGVQVQTCVKCDRPRGP